MDAQTASQISPRVYLGPQLNLQLQHGADKNRENLPTTREIAMIIPNEYANPSIRDILLTRRNPGTNDQYRLINRTNPAYYPLAYPLLFFYGGGDFN